MKTLIQQNHKWHTGVVLFMLLTFGSTSMWADSWNWTYASGDAIEATTAQATVLLNGKKCTWTRTDPSTCTNNNSCLQFGKNGGSETVVFYTTAIGGTITQIDVVCSSYNGKHTCAIEVGGTTVLAATATASGDGSAAANISTGTISATGGIRMTFTKGTGARAVYIKSITVTYTPGSTYNVNWVVGGTTTKAETGVSAGTPPSVADNALGVSCSGIKFLGWSETNVGSSPTSAPADLFPSSDVPALGKNTTFYAVFGEVGFSTSDTIRSQVLVYDTWTYGGTTSNQSGYRLFGNTGYVESAAFDLSTLLKVIVCGGTYGGAGNNGISIKDNASPTPNVWKTGTVSGTGNANPHAFTGGSALTGTGVLRVYSTSGNASSTGVRMSKVCIFTSRPTYSNCISICCTANDITLQGDGTLTYGTISTDVPSACEGATITLGASICGGYTWDGAWKVYKTGTPATTVSVTGSGDGATFTMPAYAVTVELNSTPTIKTDHFKDVMHSTTGYTGDGYAVSGCNQTVPTISPKPVPSTAHCDDKHYLFVGWVLSTKVLEDGTLDAGAVVVPGNTTSWNASGATYYAIWAEKE